MEISQKFMIMVRLGADDYHNGVLWACIDDDAAIELQAAYKLSDDEFEDIGNRMVDECRAEYLG